MSAQRGFGRWIGNFGLVLAAGLLFGGPAHAQNVAPTISGTPPTTAVVGQTYYFRPTATDANGDRLSFSATGVPGWAQFDKRSGRIYGSPNKRNLGKSHTVLITVSDGKLRASLPQFTITVTSTATATVTNNPPTIGGSPPASVVEGELYGFVPTASDPEGDGLVFSISGKPSWATFTTSTGLLSGIPPAGSAATYAGVQISVSDGRSSASLPAFSITVNPKPNSPPSIWGIPTTSVNSGQSYSFRPEASDPEGQGLRFSIVGMPSWARFDSTTGTLSGTPAYANAGTYPNIVISVSDGQASTALAPFSITVAGINTPPTISGTPAGSVTGGQTYSFTPTVTDPDGQALTFSISNRPAWANFNSGTGRLSGSPTNENAGTYSGITISVNDGQATSTLPPFSITVTAVNTPPVISGTPPTSVTVGQAYNFLPYASDLERQTLTFSIVNRPTWASFDAATGRLSGTPTSAHVGAHSGITISVSDGQASTSLASFSITVVATNTPPTISGTPANSVTDGQTYSFTPTASDPDSGQSLTFSITNRPSWANFDAATGRLSGTPTSAHAGTYSGITISVSDGQASATLPQFSINVLAATSGSATVRWSPPTSFEDGTPISNLAGYRVVYGQSSTALSQSITIPSAVITSATIEDLSRGTWYFAVKAYTTANVESNLSNIASKTIN